MKSLPTDTFPDADATSPTATLKKVPRLDSLLHRLQRAKDADGKPIPLLDELLFFLDDPPPGTTDRWQQGADLCENHGITTSRMSVWRFYRAHILPWRREQNPPPAKPVDAEEIARIHDQARQLAAQRALEFLNDPRLAPGQLIGFLQNDNKRQQIQLARDQFNDRVTVRQGLQKREYYRAIDQHARDKALIPAQTEFVRKLFTAFMAVPSHTTP